MGAVCFAVLGFGAATVFEPYLPNNESMFWFVAGNVGIGIAMGWMVMGRLVGGDYRAAARAGVGTAFWMLLWAIVIFSLRLMLTRSLGLWYKAPMDALNGALEIGWEYATLAMHVEVLGVLLVGGMLGGVVTEFAKRRWR